MLEVFGAQAALLDFAQALLLDAAAPRQIPEARVAAQPGQRPGASEFGGACRDQPAFRRADQERVGRCQQACNAAAAGRIGERQRIVHAFEDR